MSKFVTQAMFAALGIMFGSKIGDSIHRPRGRTPGIPHSGVSSRTHAVVPDDGRWHMKHHRGRV